MLAVRLAQLLAARDINRGEDGDDCPFNFRHAVLETLLRLLRTPAPDAPGPGFVRQSVRQSLRLCGNWAALRAFLESGNRLSQRTCSVVEFPDAAMIGAKPIVTIRTVGVSRVTATKEALPRGEGECPAVLRSVHSDAGHGQSVPPLPRSCRQSSSSRMASAVVSTQPIRSSIEESAVPGHVSLSGQNPHQVMS